MKTHPAGQAARSATGLPQPPAGPWLAAALLCALPVAARAADPIIQLSTGVDYSTGKYGAPETTDAYIEMLGAKLTLGPWAFRAFIPFAQIRGPADVTVLPEEGGGEVIDSSTEELNEPGRRTGLRSGISDISLSATRSFDRIGGTPLYLDATARVRMPTGDQHIGLGTGATDYFLEGELGGDWKRGGLYLDFGRRFLGAVSGQQRLDSWTTSLGGWWNASRKTQLGLSYDWRGASVAGIPGYQLVGGYVAWRITPSVKLQLYSGAGLSSPSPNFDASFSLIYRPTGRRR